MKLKLKLKANIFHIKIIIQQYMNRICRMLSLGVFVQSVTGERYVLQCVLFIDFMRR